MFWSLWVPSVAGEPAALRWCHWSGAARSRPAVSARSLADASWGTQVFAWAGSARRLNILQGLRVFGSFKDEVFAFEVFSSGSQSRHFLNEAPGKITGFRAAGPKPSGDCGLISPAPPRWDCGPHLPFGWDEAWPVHPKVAFSGLGFHISWVPAAARS